VLKVVKDCKNRGSITWLLSCGSWYGAAVGYSDHRYVALWFRCGISWLAELIFGSLERHCSLKELMEVKSAPVFNYG